MSEPFGALAPTTAQTRWRALGARLPANYFGRKAASLLLGPAGGRARRPHDVTVFGSQKARLHPYDNICEKRVFLTPQLWDGAEREALADFIAALAQDDFVFVDIGANAGLYTLFARSEAMRAGKRLRAVCIEADPEMLARLRFNVAASGAVSDVVVFGCAASGAEGILNFTVNDRSRGLSRVAPEGETRVASRPLLGLVEEARASRVDALKIDIEGHESATLGAFFRDAPVALHPTLIIVETTHQTTEQPVAEILRAAGYAVRLQTARNAVFRKGAQTFG